MCGLWSVLCLLVVLENVGGSDFGPAAWSCSIGGGESDDSESASSYEGDGLRCNCLPMRDGTSLSWTKLDCAHKGFTEIVYGEKLPYHVRSLNLSWNRIRFIEGGLFDRFRPLVQLFFNHNGLIKIEEHALAGLTALEVLDLSHNNLAVLSEHHLMNLSALKELDLSWNSLQSLPPRLFQNISHLDSLSLSGNVKIGEYIFNYPEALKDVFRRGLRCLKLNHLQLTDLPENLFNEAYDLEELHISHNYFKKLPNLYIGSLQILNISSTNISRLETGNFLYLPSLKIIHMNRMKYLTHIEEGAFVGLKHLAELSLEKCHNLSLFDGLAFGGPSYTLPHLRLLSLKHSGLQTLSKKLLPFLSTIETLKLQGNPWDCDCRIRWFKEMNFTKESDHHIRCYFPPHLRNETISNLTASDFVCMTKRARVLYGLMITMAVLFGLLALLLAGAYVDTLRRRHCMARRSHRIHYDPMLVQLHPNRADWDDDSQGAISFIHERDREL